MAERAVNQGLAAEHGLSADEYARILALLGRTPSLTELGIFSAMWNEHCSYKSSRKWLRLLPSDGPQVIQGPGENAGVVDIGDGLAVVFKMESHNHPSFIEPHQGAATGVGGILRDVFTMGARPVAVMNALSFGSPRHPRTRALVEGVVSGIGSYGNAFGVPNVGGELRFHASYNGNCLVNAFAAGIARADAIFYARASGVGRPVVYLGARTGRDGVGGATMASAAFGADVAEERPTVQVGDPFTEKRLLEACLELMASGAVVAIQDMGAAGLTCSAVEMGDKGGLGIRLDLDAVPCREPGMTAFEMMLSESQERMLMVLHPEKEGEARAIFAKWDLDFAIVGETIAEDRFLVLHEGRVEADLPLRALSGLAPVYERPWTTRTRPAPLDDVPEIDPSTALLAVLGSPNYCSRAWVWEQYDQTVLADTMVRPGSDAGVVRVHGTEKALAFSCDVTPRYCRANPFEGGKQAVAEAFRNLCATGARPLALTDNLNFGNPERPEAMGELVGCIKGIAEAARALDMPVVSGNVSLYNETEGKGILPTPTIVGVGLLQSRDELIGMAPRPGDMAILLGETRGHLGQSALMAELYKAEEGDAPPVDLAAERAAGEMVRRLKADGLLSAAHDLSDGGLAVAAGEMALAARTGVTIRDNDELTLAEWFFGEDQGRYLLAVAPDHLAETMRTIDAAGLPCAHVGDFGGETIDFAGRRIALGDLRNAWENGLRAFLG